MKKFFLIITALAGMTQVCNASQDTVTVIEQPQQVVITETPSGVKVTVQGSKEDNTSNYSYSVEHQANDKVTTSQDKDWEVCHPFSKNKRKARWSLVTDGFYMGGGISHSWDMINNSFEIGLLNIMGLNYDTKHGQVFSLGIGIHHRSYSLKRPNLLQCDAQTHVVSTGLYPEDVTVKKRSSNLNLWAFQFPLMFRQKLYKDLAIKVGGIMNWNYRMQVHNRYKVANTEYDITQRGLKQKYITFDLMGGLSLGEIGIYCRYSPSETFKKGYGPEIKNTWMLGGIIAF